MQVIGAILHNGDNAIPVLQALKTEYFKDEICKAVFKCLKNGYEQKKHILHYVYVGKILENDEIIQDIYKNTSFISVEDAENMAGIIKREYLKNKTIQEIATADTDEKIIKLSEQLAKDIESTSTGENNNNVFEYLQKTFEKELDESRKNPAIKTGFENFDKEMNGLYAGLYVIGAISSLGKTTLIHQIADNIAGAGTPVLYFSPEMSRLELVTKSITRIATKQALEQGYKGNELETVCKPSIYWRSHGIETEAGKQALKTYTETIAGNMNIIQGDFDTDVYSIRTEIQRFIRQNTDKPKPVIFIDYLQIIKPIEDRKSTLKDNIDMTVTELKRISRDFNIPVIVVSSFNRNNYMMPVSFESFKESGGIEYTADVVIGLQLSILNSEIFSKETGIKQKREEIRRAKAENPRQIDLQVLKNRYGKAVNEMAFEYFPQYDLFTPATRIQDTVMHVAADTPKGKPNKYKNLK